MAVRVGKMEAADLGKKNDSCKSGPRTVVGVGAREKERCGNENSKYRPSPRKFFLQKEAEN